MDVQIPLADMVHDLENVIGITATEVKLDCVELEDGTLAQLTAKLETDQNMWILSDKRTELEVGD